MEQKKTFLQEIVEKGKKDVKNAEDALAQAIAAQPIRQKLAQIIDDCLDGLQPDYYYLGWRFEFRMNSTEEAREFSSRLLDKLSIEKAEKEFDGWGSSPVWKYVIHWEGEVIKIEPADSDKECIPEPVAHASTHWVCRKS